MSHCIEARATLSFRQGMSDGGYDNVDSQLSATLPSHVLPSKDAS